MKKIIGISSILLLVMMIAACNNESNKNSQAEDEPGIGIPPILIEGESGTELTAFFEKYLGVANTTGSDYFFVGDKENKCMMINTTDEFRKSVPFDFPVELPAIDFDVYTLIVGQYWVPSGGYWIHNHSIDMESEEAVLNLTITRLSGANHCAEQVLFYWGIYPKLSGESIIINVIDK